MATDEDRKPTGSKPGNHPRSRWWFDEGDKRRRAAHRAVSGCHRFWFGAAQESEQLVYVFYLDKEPLDRGHVVRLMFEGRGEVAVPSGTVPGLPVVQLVGLLVLALGAKNVTVQSPLDYGRSSREDIRVKDTRAALVKHCDGKTWHLPGALFPLSEEERDEVAPRTNWVGGTGGEADAVDEPGDGIDTGADGGTDDEAGDLEGLGHRDEGEGHQPYAIAAE